jgi:hypothetical protein
LGIANWVKEVMGFDLKQQFSLERTRVKENYALGDLAFDENDQLKLTESHRESLSKQRLRTWSPMKYSIALYVLENCENWFWDRRRHSKQFKESWPREQWVDIPDGIPLIKQPVLIQDAAIAEQMVYLGVKKQYPSTWPMANSRWPNALKLYKELYTLPVHEKISSRTISKILKKLKYRS